MTLGEHARREGHLKLLKIAINNESFERGWREQDFDTKQ